MNKDSRCYVLEVKLKVYNMMDNGGDFLTVKKPTKNTRRSAKITLN